MQNLISNSNYLMSSKGNDEERAIHPNSDNTEIMISDKADEVIRKTFSVTFFRVSNWAGNFNER